MKKKMSIMFLVFLLLNVVSFATALPSYSSNAQFTYGTSEEIIAPIEVEPHGYHLGGTPTEVALFKDSNPWGYTAIEDLLLAYGISYDVYTSAHMGIVDLSPYDKVITASVQGDTFWNALEANKVWFENYVNDGGILEMHLCAYSGSISPGKIYPGGFVFYHTGIEEVSIVDPTHPVLNTPNTITDDALDNWYYSAHGWFSAIPAGASEVLEATINGNPVFADCIFGSGAIFATTQTVEWRAGGGYPEFLENMILYMPAPVPILIVADDDGSDLVRGTSLPEFESALTAADYSYSVWIESTMGHPSLEYLLDFALVIWTCGDYWGWAVDPTDAATLESYLAQGGNILLEGEDIGFDHGSDSFMVNVAHATMEVDGTGAPGLTVSLTHPVTQGLPTTFTWETTPPYDDDVTPTNGGYEVIRYTGTSWTAVTVYDGSGSNGAVVYHAFPIYCLGQLERDTLIINSVRWLTQPPLYSRILWDDTHDTNGDDLYTTFSTLYGSLIANGYTVVQLNETQGPITSTILANYHILVIPDPEAALSSSEITAIQSFISAGGRLWVIGEWLGAFDRESVNTLLAPYGIAFGTADFEGTITNMAVHPITSGVSWFTYILGSDVNVWDVAQQIAWYDAYGVLAVWDDFSRVVAIGDSDVFEDVFLEGGNLQLGLNIIDWLAARPPAAKWTFMVYLDADNNLEGAGIDDFLEMAAVGSTDDVNIVVQMDRIGGWDTSYDNWIDCKRYLVTYGMTPTIANALQGLAEVNMGDPNTLANFMVWGIQNYPADHYVVVLWDHGSGWKLAFEEFKGVCFDDTDLDYLTTIELEQALANVESTTGVEVDIVGFDACLMGMIEIAYQIKDLADVMVASEEVEPLDGWPYDDILSSLTSDPAMTSSALATEIVTDYIASYMDPIVTQSAANLGLVTYATVNDLAIATSNFAQELINGLPAYRSEITQARQQTEEYYDPTYVDLYHFTQLIHTLIPDPDIQTAAEQVMDTLTYTVIAEGHLSEHPNSHGLSIYFPQSAGEYDSSYENLAFATDTIWDEFLNQYYIPTYDVTIKAHCYTEGVDVSVSITMDGSPTGYNTPHTFTGLAGTHTFTVPDADPNEHPFIGWSTGETSTTITITTGGTYTAYYARATIVATCTYLLGNPTVYKDVIAFSSDPDTDLTLMYYTISTGTLTNTGIIDAYFPSVYGNTIAFATFVTPPFPWETYIGIYDIPTGTVNMILHPDPGDVFDPAVWNNGEAPAVSISDNIIGFYDYEGIWYYDIATTTWTLLSATIGSTKFGISVCSDIIAFSEGPPGSQTIRYHDVSTGITTDTGINGVHPTVCHNVIAFEWGNTIYYYDIDTGTTTDTGATGIQPWIWKDLIAFTANGEIKYYNMSSGLVANTGEVGMYPSLWGRAAFITIELDIGIDVNGDGDFADWVVRFLTIQIPGDVNGDGVVNMLDRGMLSAHWFPGPPIGPLGYDPIADINCDGAVNMLDLAIVSAYWTGPPKGPLAP